MNIYRKNQSIHKKEKGQIIVILALVFIGLVAIVGLSIDMGYMYVSYSRLRRAVDGAALAATSQFRENYTITGLEAVAKQFLQLNDIGAVGTDPNTLSVFVETCDNAPGDPEVCTDPKRKLVRVTVTERVPLFFLSVVGLHEIPIKVSSISEAATVDLVLLIDTSNSMALGNSGQEVDPSLCNVGMGTCHPMQEIKAAASSLVDTLYESYDRVAIVTFSRFPKVEMPMSGNLGAVKTKIAQLDVYEGYGKCPWDPGIYPTTPAEVAAIDPTLLKDGPCRLDVLGVFSRFTCQGLADPNPINWDARDCTTTNSGGGLRVAGNVLGGLYPDGYYFPGGGSAPDVRPTALWVVVWLTDGYTNAGFALDGKNVSDDNLNNQILNDGSGDVDPKQNAFCPKYTWTWQQGTQFRPCADLDARPTLAQIAANPSTPYILGRHEPDPAGTPLNDLVYDADDYARDMVDFVTDPVHGQGAMLFSIGLGNGVTSKTTYEIANNLPAPGETLLKYGAEKGGGIYYFAPDSAQLNAIFLAIANKIATRLSR
jgi:Flp pilus assembly protein TadG